MDHTRRISFNEITKNAVKNSLKASRGIDMNLVNAQQTRRILDRMVGYSISPLLWKKVKRGLSAGRVQSATLRMVADREEEIKNFVPEEYWTLDLEVPAAGRKKPLVLHYHGCGEQKEGIPNEASLQAILKDIQGGQLQVISVRRGERVKRAPLPFTTSTLQQEAAKTLNFSTSKTMRLAQQLYEGVEVKGRGVIGLISYLRTDSTRVSDEAAQAAEAFIRQQYGPAYAAAAGESRPAGQREGVQDAHEAIRPTDVSLMPAQLKEELPRDLFRLYQLIWRRFTASRMMPAIYDTLTVRAAIGVHSFTASGARLTFEGYRAVYSEEEDKEEASMPAGLEEGMELTGWQPVYAQHFTQPPAHYTEASLVRAMEELGIGRPSTYAPTITTLLARRYCIKESRNLFLSELGEVVNGIMCSSFPVIVDLKFTAALEQLLDRISEGAMEWKTVVRNFWPDLEEAVKVAEQELEKVEVADEVSDEVCELCGRNMVIKYGANGKFLACPGFPECRNAKPYFEKTGVTCPSCGGELLVKRTRKGRRYYGCSNYPTCEYMAWQLPRPGEGTQAAEGVRDSGPSPSEEA